MTDETRPLSVPELNENQLIEDCQSSLKAAVKRLQGQISDEAMDIIACGEEILFGVRDPKALEREWCATLIHVLIEEHRIRFGHDIVAGIIKDREYSKGAQS
jgi:hypothetical protein